MDEQQIALIKWAVEDAHALLAGLGLGWLSLIILQVLALWRFGWPWWKRQAQIAANRVKQIQRLGEAVSAIAASVESQERHVTEAIGKQTVAMRAMAKMMRRLEHRLHRLEARRPSGTARSGDAGAG